MLTLRGYQRECLDSIKALFKEGKNRQLVSLPTGAGKTVIFANLIKELGLKTLCIAHTNELLEQSRDKIRMIAPDLSTGLLNGDNKEFDKPVLVSSIQSARQPKNLEELKRQGFELLIYDEAHHAASDSSKLVLGELGFCEGTNRLLCGFTATAFRSDSKGLGEIFDVVSYERSIKEMIADGFLTPPKGIRVKTDIDLSLVKKGGDDFQAESLAQVMDVPEIRQIVVNSYIEKGEGRQTICFAVTVAHARNLANLFRKHNIPAQVIHGGLPSEDREDILKEYRSGKIKVLCNCQILIEGFDHPETSCILLAKPTQSKGLYAQMCGRGLRLFPNKKDCLILDFSTKHHSLCNTATLFEDGENEREEQEERAREKEIRSALPATLNQKLKAALIAFDPLDDEFTWTLNENEIYVLKGNNVRIGIIPRASENRYKVILAHLDERIETIADGISFEYAFSAAQDFAKSNRALFLVSDREAAWRDLPASNKQLDLIRSKGYRAGLKKLKRGQASDLIGSGALRKSG